MTIDIHTHVLTEKLYNDYARLHEGKINKLFALAFWHSDMDKLLDLARKNKNLYVIGALDFKKNISEQVARLRELFEQKKIFGLKLYPGYQHFYPFDEKIFPAAELCVKFNKPLIFHSGDICEIYEKGNPLLKYSFPSYIDELAVKFPACKIIISHFGFPYFMETALVVNKNENVYTEISGTIDRTKNIQEKKELTAQYIADLKRVLVYYPLIKSKIMFGTDYCGDGTPLCEVLPYMQVVEKVFPKEERENVFSKLAEKLFLR